MLPAPFIFFPNLLALLFFLPRSVLHGAHPGPLAPRVPPHARHQGGPAEDVQRLLLLPLLLAVRHLPGEQQQKQSATLPSAALVPWWWWLAVASCFFFFLALASSHSSLPALLPRCCPPSLLSSRR